MASRTNWLKWEVFWVSFFTLFCIAGAFFNAPAATAPKPGAGWAEVFRRTLPVGSQIRIRQGASVVWQGDISGDVRIELGSGNPSPLVTNLESLTAPARVKEQVSGTATVTLTNAVTNGTGETVVLNSNAPALDVPDNVIVLPNQRSATFTWEAGNVATPTLVTVNASLRGVVKVAQVWVDPVEEPPPPPPPPPTPSLGWYVAPTGKATNNGTIDSPWDLNSTIDGSRRAVLGSGGTVYLLPGVYRIPPESNREGLGYRCFVGGTPSNPLIFRGTPDQKVVLDGGWSFFTGSNYTWLWGVTVTVTDLIPGKPPFGLSGSWPEGAPNGGVSFYDSVGCKVVNCIAVNNRQGINMWTEAKEAEAYGNLIYDNGWLGSDRAHGHGLYIQNPATTRKLVSNNLFSARASVNWRDGRYTLHGYGERVAVTNITAEENISVRVRDAMLLNNGVDAPSEGHVFRRNMVHAVRLRLGATSNQRLQFRDNTLMDGVLELPAAGVDAANNLIAPPNPRPAVNRQWLGVNKYEPARAHLMLWDWTRAGKVTADLTAFAPVGAWVVVHDPTDFWGRAVWEGNVPAGGVDLPTPGGAMAYVLTRQQVVPGAAPAAPRSFRIEARIEEAPVARRVRR